ncbi:MAG: Factor arrest protein 11 [Watsoniomyces obsoletus]|nr:MAG: Factor arrest protein 11 [Watsoniomyces obsoletus]
MSGIGEASAIITVAGLGLNLSTALISYVADFKEAAPHISRVSDEVVATSDRLKELGELVAKNKEHRVFSQEGLERADKLATSCRSVLTEIRKTLQKVDITVDVESSSVTNSEIDISKFSKLAWPFVQKSLEVPRSELNRLKIDLLLLYQSAKLAGTKSIPKLERSRKWAQDQVENAMKRRLKPPTQGMKHVNWALPSDDHDKSNSDNDIDVSMPEPDEMQEFLAYQERRIEEERKRVFLAEIALQEKEERDKAAEEKARRKEIGDQVLKEWQERQAIERQRENEERLKRNAEYKEKLRKELEKMQLPKTQIEHAVEQAEEETLDATIVVPEGAIPAGSSSGQNKGSSSAGTVKTGHLKRSRLSFMFRNQPYQTTLATSKTPSIQSSMLGLGVLRSGNIWDGIELEAWSGSPFSAPDKRLVFTRMPLPEALLVQKILQQEKDQQKRSGKTIWERFTTLHPSTQYQIEDVLHDRNKYATSESPWVMVFLEIHTRRTFTFYSWKGVSFVHIIIARRNDAIQSRPFRPSGNPPSIPTMDWRPTPSRTEYGGIEYGQPSRPRERDHPEYTAPSSTNRDWGPVDHDRPPYLPPDDAGQSRPPWYSDAPPRRGADGIISTLEEVERQEANRRDRTAERERRLAGIRADVVRRAEARGADSTVSGPREREVIQVREHGRAGRRHRQRVSSPDSLKISSDDASFTSRRRRRPARARYSRTYSRWRPSSRGDGWDNSGSDEDPVRVKGPLAYRLKNALSLRKLFPRREKQTTEVSTDLNEFSTTDDSSGADSTRVAELYRHRRSYDRPLGERFASGVRTDPRSRRRTSLRERSKEREERRYRLGLLDHPTQRRGSPPNPFPTRPPGMPPPMPQPMHGMPPPMPRPPQGMAPPTHPAYHRPMQPYVPGPRPFMGHQPFPQLLDEPQEPTPASYATAKSDFHRGSGPGSQFPPMMPPYDTVKIYDRSNHIKDRPSRMSSYSSWNRGAESGWEAFKAKEELKKEKQKKKESKLQESDKAVLQRYMKYTSAPEAIVTTAGEDEDNITAEAPTSVEDSPNVVTTADDITATTAPSPSPPTSAPTSEFGAEPNSIVIEINGVNGDDLVESPNRVSMDENATEDKQDDVNVMST